MNVKNVYAASIDNRYIQLIASILNNTNFYTFDDGLANLNYNGSYYKNEELSRIREFLWGIIGVDFFVQNFRKRSKIHYSIYQDKKNIIDMVENISLFNGVKYKNSDVRGEINIFLGQPLYEVNVLADNEYINNVLKKLNINMYFPHPRENYIIDGNLDVIKSNLIFEDYILEFFEKNEQLININIYTFFSTAVLNLSNLYFINTYIVYDSKFNKDIYDIFGSFSVKYIFLNGI